MSTQAQIDYLIVGGGLAAVRAVEGIREVDQAGEIALVTAEPHPPYERPPLSKGVLLGTDPVESVFPHPHDWYAEHGVTLYLGDPAVAVDASAHRLHLASGTGLGWQRLLLATGSRLRKLDVPGADLAGVGYLRTLADSLNLLERFRERADVVVVGAGWIGLEVAAAARQHHCHVTVLEPQAAPLVRTMGERVGGWFADLHTRHGVDLRLGVAVERLVGNGAVAGVVTDSGVTIPADVVVVGVGIQPETALAQTAGVALDNGVLTDSALRTSIPGIWAAGDVANWDSGLLGRHVRVEHWANAYDGGLAAGRSMAGAEVTYDPVPFFYSDQYDVGLEYAGYVPPDAGAEVVIRGDPATDKFMVFWVQSSGGVRRVLAGMHVNTWDTMDAVQALIRNRTPVDVARLSDAHVPLDELVSSRSPG